MSAIVRTNGLGRTSEELALDLVISTSVMG